MRWVNKTDVEVFDVLRHQKKGGGEKRWNDVWRLYSAPTVKTRQIAYVFESK